ncbi:MAG: c-type cytochrome, partial [Planctomycetales bacterium]|nr:c-type cytochrome [Planctomycetales bacterium]
NTFRFRQDGSRIEHFTHGQVNPFGMTSDEWGHWYTADCHSKPLTALLRGACYPSFGRPHDGLGFAPPMMTHLHGSTAICGLHYYRAQHFPAAYRQRFYSGNVMTSRINANALEWRGATATARELPDFMTSDDPWFRPVDVQLGPDGALYVADFYNKIIGHYEVPLEHPDRDRDSGRIWRIVYRGDQPHQPLQAPPLADEQPLADERLLAELGSDNPLRRELAVDAAVEGQLVAEGVLLQHLREPQASERLRLSCLQILARRQLFDFDTLHLPAAAPHRRLLAAWLRLSSELPAEQQGRFLTRVRNDFPYPDPQVNRAACLLLGAAGDSSDVPRLAAAVQRATGDPAAVQAARLALRSLLRSDRLLATITAGWSSQSTTSAATNSPPANLPQTASAELPPPLAIDSPAAAVVAQVLPGLDSALAAQQLLNFLAASAATDPAAAPAPAAPEVEAELLDHAIAATARHASPPLLAQLLQVLEQRSRGDLIIQAERFEQLCKAYLGRHSELAPSLQIEGQKLQQRLREELARQLAHRNGFLGWQATGGKPWGSQPRRCADGTEAELRSSILQGEQYTGSLVSPAFACPPELRFWLAGHNGDPQREDLGRNVVQLRLVDSGEIVAQALPPRSDIASEIVWELEPYVRQAVQVQLLDGDSGDAYAWLAAGRFSLELLNSDGAEALFTNYLRCLRRGFREAGRPAADMLDLPAGERLQTLAAALHGAGATTASGLLEQAIALDRLTVLPDSWISAAWHSPRSPGDLLPLATDIAAHATSSQQRDLARSLLSTADGCQLLKQLLEQGSIGRQSLRGAEELWPSALATETRLYLQQQVQRANLGENTAPQTQQRIAALDLQAADVALGEQLYQQHCAACHQLHGQGKLVGPQLDGVLSRGPQRLGEDILQPQANVDKAFRVTALLLTDDVVVSGLLSELPDGSLQLRLLDGTLQTIAPQRVLQRRETLNSLMPSNFGELLSDAQLAALLKYLASPAPRR